jgi:hypothetical protein
MFNKIKNVQNLRSQAKQLQELLANESAEGTAGWGKVKVTINGNQEIQTVSIDPELMNDKSKLEGLIKEAVNDAIKKIQRAAAMKMQQSGFGLPGLS